MANEEENQAIDAEVRAHLARGDLREAASVAIRRIGPEVFGYVRAVVRDEDIAADVFAETCEAVWTDLERFEAPSVRAWMFVIARHRVLRAGRAAAKARRHQPLSRTPEVAALAHEARSTTTTWRRTEAKDKVAAMRDALDPDEQTLLVLRLDRGMEWREVSHVMEVSEAALRKRFERLLARLRDQAKAAKLIR